MNFRHDLPAVEALAEHADFFWRVGLGLLKKLLEGDGAARAKVVIRIGGP